MNDFMRNAPWQVNPRGLPTSELKGVTQMTEGIKHDNGKARMDLLPPADTFDDRPQNGTEY